MNINNNNNPQNQLGGGMMGSARPVYGQWQSQFGSGFHNQYSLSQAQAVARAQAALQGQAVHGHYNDHLRGQGVGLNLQQNYGYGGFGRGSTYLRPGGGDVNWFPQSRQTGPRCASVYNTPPNMSRMEVSPATGRMTRQSPERQLHKNVAALLPESALYTQLLEFENRIDAELINKKHDVQEAMKNPRCFQKILRVYIFNTFSHQVQTTAEDADTEPPTWTLRVTGRVLEDEEDPNQPETMHKPNVSYPKFSTFFKKVTIKLDEKLYPDNNTIVWEQARSAAGHDGFEVKRKGNKEFNAQVKLEVNYAPKKFRLSSELSQLLRLEVETRPRIIAAVWHYIKARNLQDSNDSTSFICDLPLQKIFGQQKMKFTMVSQKISPHLSPPPPIDIEHWVKLSGNSPAVNACYDVSVDLPFPIQKDLEGTFEQTEKTGEIKACDTVISDSILKINEHLKRRAFFLGFSQSPMEFIDAFIESHSQDLNIVAGESACVGKKKHVSEFYNQPWVEDAVIRYLNRKPEPAAGKDGRRGN